MELNYRTSLSLIGSNETGAVLRFGYQTPVGCRPVA
jgi:hypothetical protein